MALEEFLREAQYIHRGDNGELIEDSGQCGFLPCDNSHLVNNDDSGLECYRFCDRLKIRVSDFDSCKYYCGDEASALLQRFVETDLAISAAKKKLPIAPRHTPQRGKGRLVLILIILCLCVVLYMFLKR